MTNESLEEYIQMFNSGKWNIPFNSYRIGKNVVLGKIWYEYPTGKIGHEESNIFYFIENNSECVAIVFEMGVFDLHWFVSEKMRKNGHLNNALKEIILPFIFTDGRNEQRASAESRENIAYLLRQGFEERVDNGKVAYFLSRHVVANYDNSQIRRTTLSDNDFQKVSQQFFKLASEIRIIRDRIECAYGNDFCIEDLAEQVKGLGYEIGFKCKDS